MESEFLKDVKDLHEAFSIHVKKDVERRSILVLASEENDGKRYVQTSVIGRNDKIVALLLAFLSDKDYGYIRKCVANYLLHSSKKPLRRLSAVMFCFELVWLCVLLWMWYLIGWSEGLNTFISNALLTLWATFITFYGWKKF